MRSSSMDWSQDDDPHGVRKLLALLRTQQDRNVAAPSTSHSSLTPQFQVSAAASTPAVPFSGLLHGRIPPKEDVRYISFAHALPHLTRLSKDEAFLSALLKLKAEQDRYEEMLAKEREAFSKSKGSHPSTNSALAAWDREALRRWDSLHQEQQKILQNWNVPCFFETREPAHLKKQERVFDVLHALLE